MYFNLNILSITVRKDLMKQPDARGCIQIPSKTRRVRDSSRGAVPGVPQGTAKKKKKVCYTQNSDTTREERDIPSHPVKINQLLIQKKKKE